MSRLKSDYRIAALQFPGLSTRVHAAGGDGEEVRQASKDRRCEEGRERHERGLADESAAEARAIGQDRNGEGEGGEDRADGERVEGERVAAKVRRPGQPSGLNSARGTSDDFVTIVVAPDGKPLHVGSW